MPPEAADVQAFLKETRPDKRAVLIDTLLAREEHVDYWAMKWRDLLRVKSEFPINLWPNAVQAYQRWIREALKANMPYDRMARELLTSSGSNFRVTQVNFCRAVQGRGPQPLSAAEATPISSPPSSLRRGYDRQAGPSHWLFQGPPAESKFLAAALAEIFANRATYQDGWFTRVIHKAPWESKPRYTLDGEMILPVGAQTVSILQP